jgi:hypothetical protein
VHVVSDWFLQRSRCKVNTNRNNFWLNSWFKMAPSKQKLAILTLFTGIAFSIFQMTSAIFLFLVNIYKKTVYTLGP